MLKKQKRDYSEYKLQVQVCKYLNYQYPKVFFMSDTVANVALTVPQKVRNKAIQKDGFKCPDIIIFEPRGGFCGLFIELKTKSPYKKNGELYSNEHLSGQLSTIKDLRLRGYKADFAWTFDMAKQQIDEYMIREKVAIKPPSP